MKLKCNYCGSFIKDTDEKCPNCGAVNEHLMRSANGIPKTIEELKAFCQKHNLPLKQMRFFIGENFTEPKAFGIYKDDEGNWEYTPVDFSKAVEDEDQDGVVTYYAFYSENQAAADDAANGEEAAEQEAAGDDAEAADESSIAPQTGDATNVAAVAGIGGIAGLLAAAAALLRRRRSN